MAGQGAGATHGLSPNDTADAMFAALKAFSSDSMSGETVNSAMDKAFSLLRDIKQFPRKTKIECVWRMTQLGLFPMVVATMIPGGVTYSLSCTLLGIVLEDDDLLSHKIGKTLAADKTFLDATEAGLKSDSKSETLHVLVGQMLNNLVKTADAQSISNVCNHGEIVKRLAAIVQKSVKNVHKKDWRSPYLACDTLLRMALDEGNFAKLDNEKVGETALQFLSVVTPDPFMSEEDEAIDIADANAAIEISALLYKRLHLLHRLCAILLIWLSRQEASDNWKLHCSHASTIATAVLENPATGPGSSVSTQGPYSLHELARGIHSLISGEKTDFDKCKKALETLVRDWSSVEKSAEGMIRSEEFRQHHEATTAAKAVAVKVKAIVDKKGTGNAKFSAGEFEKAIDIYKQTLEDLTVLQQEGMSMDAEIGKSLDVEEGKISNNIAECYIRLQNFELAAEAASDAIDADPDQVKGYYRRARAESELGHVSAALDDVEEVLSRQPDNDAAKALQEELKKRST